MCNPHFVTFIISHCGALGVGHSEMLSILRPRDKFAFWKSFAIKQMNISLIVKMDTVIIIFVLNRQESSQSGTSGMVRCLKYLHPTYLHYQSEISENL